MRWMKPILHDLLMINQALRRPDGAPMTGGYCLLRALRVLDAPPLIRGANVFIGEGSIICAGYPDQFRHPHRARRDPESRLQLLGTTPFWRHVPPCLRSISPAASKWQ